MLSVLRKEDTVTNYSFIRYLAIHKKHLAGDQNGFCVLTKSSPESAPTEVMDSLLMVRGIRTPVRGAVAASSAIFFFNLANILFPSASLFEHNLQFLESLRLHLMHGFYSSLFCGPDQSRLLMQYHFKGCCRVVSILLHLEKEK